MEAAISQISPSQGARYSRLQNRFRAIVLKKIKILAQTTRAILALVKQARCQVTTLVLQGILHRQ
jgi:hypothetical protein